MKYKELLEKIKQARQAEFDKNQVLEQSGDYSKQTFKFLTSETVIKTSDVVGTDDIAGAARILDENKLKYKKDRLRPSFGEKLEVDVDVYDVSDYSIDGYYIYTKFMKPTNKLEEPTDYNIKDLIHIYIYNENGKDFNKYTYHTNYVDCSLLKLYREGVLTYEQLTEAMLGDCGV